jgi:mRNA interferase MazF
MGKAGLIKLSAVKPIITTLEKRLVIKKLGKLEAKDIQPLKNLLQQVIATKISKSL